MRAGSVFPALAAALLLLLLPVRACLAAEERDYRIAAGLLDDGLRAFAAQSGTQLLYAPEIAAGRRNAKLSGHFSADLALQHLLIGSGLRAVAVDAHTYVLKSMPPTAVQKDELPPIERPTPALRLAPVEVTGTHIRRTDVETASPLTVIDREQIERSGYQTLFDLLRAQPGIRVSNAPVAMTEGELYQNNGLATATGAASVDLRGLGSSATLFLVDGQRMAGYGLSQNNFNTVNDLNSIPLALVERVEILRDGASAIYGSDAMAGVINVIMRKDAPGLGLASSYGASDRGDARQRRVTASFGGTLGHELNALLSVDYLERQPLLGGARDWSRQRGGADTGDGASSVDAFVLDGANLRYLAGGCSARQRNASGVCIDDDAQLTSLQTGLLSRSLFAHLDRRFDALQVYADLRWTKLDQRQQMAPFRDSFMLPASHPDNRSGEDEAIYDHSFDDLGPVRDLAVSTNRFVTLGAKGRWGEWDWDAHANDQRNRSVDELRGLLRVDNFGKALRSGSFRLDAPNDDEVLQAISPVLMRHASASKTSLSVQLSGPLAQLPHGPLSMAIGAETWRDRLDDRPDPLLLQNLIEQYDAPYERSENRRSLAAYTEFNAPLTSRLQANLAWRLDRSQPYGAAVSPKLGLKWDVRDDLSLRGTWAKGYRAPTLLQLSRPPTLAATRFITQVSNTALPCVNATPATVDTSFCQLQANSVSNPQLRPETSRSYTLGVVWAPTSAFGVALDFYRIRRDHEIVQLPLSYALLHPESYPQLFQRTRRGVLYALNQQLVNLGHTDARTIDLDVRYQHRTAHLGRYDFHLGIDYLDRLNRQMIAGDPVMRYAGYASQPRVSALASLDWTYRAWSVGANLRVTGHYRYEPYAGSPLGCPDDMQALNKCETPAFALLDLHAAFNGIAHWSLTLNVHNALDHQPIYYGSPGIAYNPMFDDVVGRYYLIGIAYRP